MKNLLMLTLFLFTSFGLWANNNVNIGTLELNRGSVSLIARESGTMSLGYGVDFFGLEGASLYKFKEFTSIAIELMDKVESENITVKYSRGLGQLNSNNNKKLMISFYSSGEGYQGCTMTIAVSSMTSYEPATRLTFTGEQIKELLDMLNRGNQEVSRVNNEVAMLNAIVAKTRDIY